jgi:hypothetical protein
MASTASLDGAFVFAPFVSFGLAVLLTGLNILIILLLNEELRPLFSFDSFVEVLPSAVPFSLSSPAF